MPSMAASISFLSSVGATYWLWTVDRTSLNSSSILKVSPRGALAEARAA